MENKIEWKILFSKMHKAKLFVNRAKEMNIFK